MGFWDTYNLRTILRPSAVILMYHRIATPATDPWQLAVTPENFEQHLQKIQKNTQAISLSDLVNKIKDRTLKKNQIAITFDDGYIDNYEVAKPLLEKYNIPATFFITTKNIGQIDEFWWDELAYLILQSPTLPQYLDIHFNSLAIHFDLGGEVLLTPELTAKHRHYVAFEPPTLRAQLYFQLWESISPLPDAEQQHLLTQIRNWAGVKKSCRADYRSMREDELLALSANSLFTVGGHTTSHPALPKHAVADQQKEVTDNKHYLENLLATEVNLFAYPSGKFDNVTTTAVARAGFQAACTTQAQSVNRQSDLHRLGRYQVNDQNGNLFDQNLSKWFAQ